MQLRLRLNVDMKSSAQDMTIGQLAGHFGLAPHVLRHWESAGVLTPRTRVGGKRRYGREQLARVAFIQLAKDVGFGLEQIRRILDAPDPASQRAEIRRRHQQLESRLAELRTAQEMLGHALRCDHEDIMTCPNVQQELADRARGSRRSDATPDADARGA